jgi:hypothetical protein
VTPTSRVHAVLAGIFGDAFKQRFSNIAWESIIYGLARHLAQSQFSLRKAQVFFACGNFCHALILPCNVVHRSNYATAYSLAKLDSVVMSDLVQDFIVWYPDHAQ